MTKEKALETFGKEWFKHIYPFIITQDYQEIKKTLLQDIKNNKIIYPELQNVYKAFKLTPLEKVKVVILGQDPYYNGSASGLAFGLNDEEKPVPMSLRNILSEIENSYQKLDLEFDYSLTHWSKQGVLLLNTALTVEKNNPNTYTKLWKPFTEKVITILDSYDNHIVWMLWGNHAKSYKKLITNKTHLILESAHPSPFSASQGFFGNNHFKKANEFINYHRGSQELIKWTHYEKYN
jgi:uracil-DNA glycosylase